MSRYFILFALLACAFACGGGSGDYAEGGIGGSGISQGPITEFGSIFVNDIEWELDDAEIEFDGETVAIAGLNESEKTALFNLGMVVRVEGNAGTGQAERVFFDDEIEGPVSDLGDEIDVFVPFREFMVLGQRVRIEAGVTRFFDDNPVGGEPDFGFDTIVDGDVVEISGLIDVDVDGVVRATYVERKGEFVPGQTEVELKGTVPADFVTGTMTFVLGSVTVEFDNTTDLSGLPREVVEPEMFVEVKGTLSGADVITATKIELEDDFGDDDGDADEFSMTGFVNGFTDIDAIFFVGNQKVELKVDVEFEHGNASMLANGRRIEVEGELILGTLIAEEIEFEDREVRVHAAIALEADLAGLVPPAEEDPSFIPSFKLLGIEIRVFPSTRIGSGLLDALGVGDFLEVRGIVNSQGVITASRVELKGGIDKIRLDGPVEQFDETTGQFTILGVPVFTDGTTTFEIDEPMGTPEGVPDSCFFENLNEGDFVEVRGFDSEIFSEDHPAKDVTLKKEKNDPTCSPPP